MTRGWKDSRVKSKDVEMYLAATGNGMAVGPFGIGAWERMREGCTKILGMWQPQGTAWLKSGQDQELAEGGLRRGKCIFHGQCGVAREQSRLIRNTINSRVQGCRQVR